MAITWPAALRASSCDAELRNFTTSGGRSITGNEQRVFSGGGFWEVSMQFPVHSKEQVRAWRALVARLRTGEPALVKISDCYRAGISIASAVLAANAAAQATSISLKVNFAELEPGDRLTIDDRLYQVTEVTAETESLSIPQWFTNDDSWNDGDGVWVDSNTDTSNSDLLTVKILPPLRAAAFAGNVVELKNLTLVCVLKDVAQGDLSLDLLRFGRVSATFVEQF